MYTGFLFLSDDFSAEAQARIEGPDNKEVHVKQRSRVKLTCVVELGRGHSQDSAAVFWYLDGQSLDWLGQTGPGRGVQVTEQRGHQLISTLMIEKADMHHAGKFTCSPSYAKPDTVTLHVLDGKFHVTSSSDFPIPLPYLTSSSSIPEEGNFHPF